MTSLATFSQELLNPFPKANLTLVTKAPGGIGLKGWPMGHADIMHKTRITIHWQQTVHFPQQKKNSIGLRKGKICQMCNEISRVQFVGCSRITKSEEQNCSASKFPTPFNKPHTALSRQVICSQKLVSSHATRFQVIKQFLMKASLYLSTGGATTSSFIQSTQFTWISRLKRANLSAIFCQSLRFWGLAMLWFRSQFDRKLPSKAHLQMHNNLEN